MEEGVGEGEVKEGVRVRGHIVEEGSSVGGRKGGRKRRLNRRVFTVGRKEEGERGKRVTCNKMKRSRRGRNYVK